MPLCEGGSNAHARKLGGSRTAVTLILDRSHLARCNPVDGCGKRLKEAGFLFLVDGLRQSTRLGFCSRRFVPVVVYHPTTELFLGHVSKPVWEVS